MQKDVFGRVAKATARHCGHSWALMGAAGSVAAWLLTGPLFGWSDTWQLVINTATTIVTFLMVFLLQNSQNRDSEAIQLKLDELIRATREARNTLMDIEELSEHELDALKANFARLAQEARRRPPTE